RSYETRLAISPASLQPGTARECLLAFANLGTIMSAHASSHSEASSSKVVLKRAPPPHPDDVRIVQLLCANAARNAAGPLPADIAHRAWQDLGRVKTQLLEEMPGLTEAALSSALRNVTTGETSTEAAKLLEAARKEILLSDLRHEFDPSNPASTLWNVVRE